MSKHYQVNPRPYTPQKIVPVTKDDRANATKSAAQRVGVNDSGEIGFCVIPVLLVGALLLYAVFWGLGITETIGATSAKVLAIGLTLSLFALNYFFERFNKIEDFSSARIENERQQIQQQEAINIEEAQNLTTTLTEIHDYTPFHVQKLVQHLTSAESDLKTAEYEFNDGAFAPFWDAIERAAANLSSFHEMTRHLTGQAKKYYASLRDREHTFPQFPVALTTLPDPTHAASRMQAIVRQAQRNFQFATIYEQRKTNNILKHGFLSLSSAIADLGSTLQGSFDDLRDSVSTGFTNVVEQQIATRASIESAAAAAKTASDEVLGEMKGGHRAVETHAKEQLTRDEAMKEMLDNIQRRRKPLPEKPRDGAY